MIELFGEISEVVRWKEFTRLVIAIFTSDSTNLLEL